MNLRDLQYLVAVHDLGSFSKAAEECFVSQPTLSGQLKKLEQELDTTLIERSTRSILFTQAGLKVVAEARQILAGTERIKALARDFDDPLQGDFKLGLIPTVGPFLLPRIMSGLKAAFPQMSLFLYELRTEELLERLQTGKLDAAILAKLDWQQPFAEWPLYDEPLLLALSTQDELTRRKEPLNESVLTGKSLLMLEDGHCLRDQAMGVCFAAGANEDHRYQATSMDTLLHMVAAGHGLTLVPELATITPMAGVVYKRFRKSGPSREIVLLGRTNSARKLALEKLAEFISAAARRL